MRRIDRWKTIWSFAMLSFFGGAVVLVFTGDEAGSDTNVEHSEADAASKHEGIEVASAQDAVVSHSSEAAHGTESAHSTPSHSTAPSRDEAESTDSKLIPAGGCLADSATLEDLRRQKGDLETRQKDLAAREAELKAREQAVGDEMKKLAEARDEISRLGTTRKKEVEEKIAKLVETIETMNPKAGAALVASLDETLAVSTMSRLSTIKLAKMMNLMDPARSTKLSELMAGVVRAKRSPSGRSSSSGEAATTNSTKGGEKNDGKNNEQASNRTNTKRSGE